MPSRAFRSLLPRLRCDLIRVRFGLIRLRCDLFRPRLDVAVLACLVLVRPALAIPSPDVMVNLFASATQVLGVLSLIFGRWFLSSRARGSTSRAGKTSRIAFWVAASLALVSSIGWGLYYTAVRDEKLARLQVNLTRESSEEGKKILDVSLKELSFSDQLKRDDAITTDELARWIASGEERQILDIRESEEFEVGALRGVRHVRFPDLWSEPEKHLDKSREVVLLCFNGNRSSQLASEFETLGYQCRFMIGGYEKWLAEDRPLEMRGDHERTNLREIPEYPGRDELLDTPDVVELIERVDPIFVDVRYPGDFENNHLPGAVCIPMRKLTTAELDAALQGLPKRPVIVPCYDRRSSFFGMVIGLRLHRLGYDFLGRYMTPEGYSVPKADKPHVAAWKAAHAPKSLLTLVSERFEGVLAWLQSHLGSLALAIVALVVALRAAISPLTVWAERDRRVQAALAGRIAALKQRFRDDPRARARAISRLLNDARVRPVQDLLAAVAQLLVFTLFFSVVQRASEGSEESFSWIEKLGQPDAVHVLPFAVAALGAALIAVVASKRVALWLAPACAAILLALVWKLSSGANLYLALSLVVVIVHNLAVGWWLGRGARRTAEQARIARDRYEDAPVVPLELAHLVSGCGNKAARLGRLIEAGLPVPRGFVVRSQVLAQRAQDGELDGSDRAAIVAAYRALSSERVAVRSSGANEDGAERSYAGVFDTVLDVTEERLFDALAEVGASLASARAGAYSRGERESGAIVVQAMVPAAYAGVLFTEHPGRSGEAVVEMVAGLGDALVSGRAQPHIHRLGRFSGHSNDATPPIEVAPLFALGRRVEGLFDRPQDIEWAWSDGRFQLLQARDITRSSRDGEDGQAIRERERARLLELVRGAQADEVVLAQNELTELLPQPTPFSLAFMDSLWAQGGSTELACNALGIPYEVAHDSPPLVVSAFGELYVNKVEERRRLRRGPSSVASFRLARAADSLERTWSEFAATYLREARLRDALDLSRLSLDELVHLFGERRADFVTRVYARAEELNVAADFYLKSAMRALQRRGLDPAQHLAHMPTTVVHEAMELLAAVGRGEAQTREFTVLFGHRAPKDYEFADPRYDETPELVRSLAERAAGCRSKTPPPAPPIEGRVLAVQVERARRFQALKEEAKHHALRDVAFLRRVVVEIGARTQLFARVFQLTPDEVARLSEPEFVAVAARLANTRLEEREALSEVQLGLEVHLYDLESKDLEHGKLIPRRGDAQLVGTRVSGSGDVVGRARVLRRAEEIDSFQRGEILVARFTDPTWTSVFPLARGIVTEIGGWLSHAAIQAREYGITAVVGAAGALDTLATGDLIRVGADGSIERVPERRSSPRTALALEVRLERAVGRREGRLNDVSTGGALLLFDHGPLEVGEAIALEVEGDLRRARVARNGVPGVYGIAWTNTAEGASSAS